MPKGEWQRMKRKLDVDDTLSEVFSIYRDQAGVLIPVAFWIFLLVAIANGLTEDDFALSLLVSLVTIAVSTLYQGMVVGLVKDLRDGRRDHSVGELIGSVSPVLLTLIGASLVTAVGIGFGFLLLLVPGLYLLTIWAVIAPVIVIERRGVFEGLGRSRQLVRGDGWRVFWVVAITALIAIFAALVLMLIAGAVANGPLVLIVSTALASAFVAPIQALVASVLYFRLLDLRGAQPPAGDSVLQQPGDSPG